MEFSFPVNTLIALGLGIKVNLLGPLFAVGCGGSIVATLWQSVWDPPRRASGAQLVVDQPPLGGRPILDG